MSLLQLEARSANSRLWRTAAICIALKLLYSLSTAISTVPRLRLLESNICRTHYQINDTNKLGVHRDVPQELCKINPIQAGLAQLTGWNSFFSHTSVLLLAVPYGILSERLNRRTVLVWNISLSVLSQIWVLVICYFYNTFDIQLIWLANVIDCVGGGKLVFSTITQVMIAETIPSQHLANIYFRLTSVMSICRFLGVAGGSFLLSYSVWTPIWLAVVVYSTCLPVVMLLQHDHQVQSCNRMAAQRKYPNESVHADEHRNVGRPNIGLITSQQSLTGYLTFIKTHYWILAAFLIHETGMGVRNITEQWISKQYAWPLRTTGYILAFETFLGSIYLATLPTIVKWLPSDRRNPDSEQKTRQLVIVRASLFAAAAGTALIAASDHDRVVFLAALGVFVLGVGFHDALKAYVTGLLSSEAITRMYMCISIVETIANVFSGPTWAGIYGLGLTGEGPAMSLPFAVSSLLFLGSLGVVEQLKLQV